mmetsp:Transcript_100223/g.157966  ORF Transcript_100223/g.157966 Transcript_100223/m.157966 type:complete len:122 (+) Transcript_100223:77-442(+)
MMTQAAFSSSSRSPHWSNSENPLNQQSFSGYRPFSEIGNEAVSVTPSAYRNVKVVHDDDVSLPESDLAACSPRERGEVPSCTSRLTRYTAIGMTLLSELCHDALKEVVNEGYRRGSMARRR